MVSNISSWFGFLKVQVDFCGRCVMGRKVRKGGKVGTASKQVWLQGQLSAFMHVKWVVQEKTGDFKTCSFWKM